VDSKTIHKLTARLTTRVVCQNAWKISSQLDSRWGAKLYFSPLLTPGQLRCHLHTWGVECKWTSVGHIRQFRVIYKEAISPLFITTASEREKERREEKEKGRERKERKRGEKKREEKRENKERGKEDRKKKKRKKKKKENSKVLFHPLWYF
jgi:hypothetical protein